MSIIFNETAKTITLNTNNTTYMMKIGHLDYLLHLYYGPTVYDEDLSYLVRGYDRGFTGNVYESRFDRTFSLCTQPQEFSTLQQEDFRVPTIELINGDGSYVFDGRYASHKICEGKYALETLPATFAREGDHVASLEVTLEDPFTHVQVVLLYGVFEEADIITRAVKVINAGETTIHLQKIMSTCLDFMNGTDKDLISLYGRYAQERNVERQPISHLIHNISSGRGSSSHQQNPFAVICDHTATEDFGECYGFSLVYSGNFLAEAELDQYDQLRFVMGINPKLFNYEIKPNEVFEGPEVVMAFSEHGLTGLSHLYHDFYRTNLCKSKFVDAMRPVLINSWEACFFDIDAEKILNIARSAVDMGVDLMVMDDGWFGKRFNDMSSLGDWYVNETRIPGGLNKLVDEVNALGMKFGIWFEPESVSEDSDLYRAHPEWVLQIPGRPGTRSRNQLLLDISREDVQDYLIEKINAILDSANIYYAKFDINRSMADIWTNALPSEKLGEVYHRCVLGLYRIMDKILLTHPDILFEGCSGGGGRYDAGMLAYYPQYWTSDNNNPLDRLKLHYGTSFVYPASTMGAHIAEGGNVPLATKAAIAMGGTFGYELDATKLSDEEKKVCKAQSELFRKYQAITMKGDYYRLSNPFEMGNFTAWQHVTKDKSESLLTIVITNTTNNGPQEYVKLKGLEPKARYQLNGGEIHSGAALMRAGIPVERKDVSPYDSFLYHLVKVD